MPAEPRREPMFVTDEQLAARLRAARDSLLDLSHRIPALARELGVLADHVKPEPESERPDEPVQRELPV